MTAITMVAVCVTGGVGAALRLVLDGLIRARAGSSYPIGTMVINISGSLLLGLVTGLVAGQVLPHRWQLILGTGLLGGYTTFSTASFETVRLIEDRRYFAAVLNGLGMLIGSALAAGLGLYAGLSF